MPHEEGEGLPSLVGGGAPQTFPQERNPHCGALRERQEPPKGRSCRGGCITCSFDEKTGVRRGEGAALGGTAEVGAAGGAGGADR